MKTETPAYGRLSRAVRALIVGVSFALAATRLDAAEIRVDVHRADDAVVIEASALVDADAPTAWRVLTDYGRYADFVPGLRSSHVLSRRGPRLTVTQSGDAPLWLLRMPFEITYEVTEFPPFRLESNGFAESLRRFDSTYLLTPSPGGVRIDYVGYLAPRGALMGGLERLAARQSVVSEFRALAEEIERVGATNARSASEARSSTAR
jgi:polyketide cyclase/dehydrase/lipid transport protein